MWPSPVLEFPCEHRDLKVRDPEQPKVRAPKTVSLSKTELDPSPSFQIPKASEIKINNRTQRFGENSGICICPALVSCPSLQCTSVL